MKAVKRSIPQRGVRLVSFAIHWIKAEIHDYVLRNWRLVKSLRPSRQRKLFFQPALDEAGALPMTTGDVKRVATALNVKPEEVVEMETRLGGQRRGVRSR